MKAKYFDRISDTDGYDNKLDEAIDIINELESQLKDRDVIIRELWQTWVFLAEAGQINYGVKWGKNYDRIKEQIETLKIKLNQKKK